jgi:hypothetical protein
MARAAMPATNAPPATLRPNGTCVATALNTVAGLRSAFAALGQRSAAKIADQRCPGARKPCAIALGWSAKAIARCPSMTTIVGGRTIRASAGLRRSGVEARSAGTDGRDGGAGCRGSAGGADCQTGAVTLIGVRRGVDSARAGRITATDCETKKSPPCRSLPGGDVLLETARG